MENKEYSICKKCVKQDWCKAFNDTDLSLNDCNDFRVGIVLNNVITISFQSDYDTAKRFEHIVSNLAKRNTDGKLILISTVELETNLY